MAYRRNTVPRLLLEVPPPPSPRRTWPPTPSANFLWSPPPQKMYLQTRNNISGNLSTRSSSTKFVFLPHSRSFPEKCKSLSSVSPRKKLKNPIAKKVTPKKTYFTGFPPPVDWSWSRHCRASRPLRRSDEDARGDRSGVWWLDDEACEKNRDPPSSPTPKRKTIPLMMVSDESPRESRPLTLLQAVTSTLSNARKRRRGPRGRSRSRPRARTNHPRSTPGAKGPKIVVPQSSRGSRKPDSFEKLLLDALSVPSKFSYMREKIMGTRNYMKLFFPPDRLQSFASEERMLPCFPNYPQLTRTPKLVSNITLAQYITNVLSFMRETIYKQSEKEQEQMQTATPTDRYRELPETPVED